MTDDRNVEAIIRNLLQPIVGIENRTPQEVFSIMADGLRAVQVAASAEALEHERRILRAETGTQRILNQLYGDIAWFATAARSVPDALDPKAADILSNIAKRVREIDVEVDTNASGMSAGTAETAQQAQGEARQPDGDSRDAQGQSHD